jgi:hypothetical protein
MFDDDTLHLVDQYRLLRIEQLRQQLNIPQRNFVPPYGKYRDFPYNDYPIGARFNIGMDVFKIISYRTRGKRPSLVARFDGVLNP